MATRPAYVYNGSGWDDIGDKRIGAEAGDIPQASVEDLTSDLASKVDYALPTNAQTGTAYTFVAADAEKLTTASNGSAVTLTIPPASSVAWPDNTVLRVVNYGAGAVTVAGGSGVTVTNTATTLGQYEAAAAIRTGSDAWTLVPFGSKTAAPSSVEYLVIAGGASGGARASGDYGAGGGAGGYRCSVSGESSGGGASAETAFSAVANTSYTVTVGAGGASRTAGSGLQGNPGNTSSFDTISSVGGGGGGGINTASGAGASGGSGGGGTGGGSGPGGAGTANQGYDGGDGQGGGYAGAGGGAGGAGTDSGGSQNTAGGAGVSSLITGSSVTRAAGGNGGSFTIIDGAANTGNGGSGSLNLGDRSGAGGKGVVIIRQALSDSTLIATTTGSPTVALTATHIIYTFNDSGTIEWAA